MRLCYIKIDIGGGNGKELRVKEEKGNVHFLIGRAYYVFSKLILVRDSLCHLHSNEYV